MSELNHIAGSVPITVGRPVGHTNVTCQRYCAMAVLRVVDTLIALVGMEDSSGD